MRKLYGMAALSAVCLLLALLQERCTTITAKETQSTPVCRCGGLTFPLNNTLPSSSTNLSSQVIANCYGWNEFIALNWPANASLPFGEPGDVSPVQWETFMSVDLIFLPGGQKPPPWGNPGALPLGANKRKFATGKYLVLDENQKVPKDFSSNQVVINPGPAWLGAQNGTNIWYEVLVNKVEYDYIVSNGFYNAQAQYDSCSKGKQILLPAAGDGAIEIKSAWMEVKDTANPKWRRYKLSLAYVEDTAGGAYHETVVALIGMHILRKTLNQPTFVWATFEQVDNLPDPASGSQAPYNLFNDDCKPNTLTVKTRLGKDTIVTVGCTPNQQPPYYLVNGNKPAPVQVSRLTSLHTKDNDSANNQAVRGIVAAYPNTVWQYYRLVNVIWSTAPAQDGNQNATDSMKLSAMQPTSAVANATMETYNQNTTCAQTCHKFATIASIPGMKNPKYLTDFSFVFHRAKTTAKRK